MEQREQRDLILLDLSDVAMACADAHELNGPAFFMFFQEIEKLGRPVRQVTVGELVEAIQRAKGRYHLMYNRLRELEA